MIGVIGARVARAATHGHDEAARPQRKAALGALPDDGLTPEERAALHASLDRALAESEAGLGVPRAIEGSSCASYFVKGRGGVSSKSTLGVAVRGSDSARGNPLRGHRAEPPRVDRVDIV